MKKFLACLVFFLLMSQTVFGRSIPVRMDGKSQAVAPVSVQVNGKNLNSAFSPFATNNRTLVPIREITESMGANVAWNNTTKSAQVSLNGKKVLLKVGSQAVYINGKKKTVDRGSIPQFTFYKGQGETKTMVPLRFLSEALDFQVDWNQERQLASISNMKAVTLLPKEDQKKASPVKKQNEAKKQDSLASDAKTEERVIQEKVHAKGPVTVVVDAGHGGSDSGAVSSVDSSVKEKDLTLKVTTSLANLLRARGYEVIETRTTDEFVKLAKRAEIANDKSAEIFVSVHFNSAGSSAANGIEILYAPESKVKIKKEEQIHLARALHEELKKATGSNMRSIKQRPDLAVLRWTEMPAALCELGFLSSPKDMEKIQEDGYHKVLATGIANGIDRYVRDYVVK